MNNMGFNIFNVFKKKEKETSDELEVAVNSITKNTAESGKRIGEAFKSLASVIKASNKSLEIQRLQKIQAKTKKQRSKNKLQKRIDSYGKDTISRY
jgi:hypothetical protein